MRRAPTHKHIRVLKAIERLCASKGRFPTYRELVKALGFNSPNSVTQYLKALCDKGYLYRGPDGYRLAVLEPDADSGARREVWKDVIGYEGFYQVSTSGRVRSVDRCTTGKNGVKRSRKGRILKHGTSVHGYPYVNLSRNGSHKLRYIHRLVAETFIPRRNSKTEVNHMDLDTTNNHVSNLEWVTKSENTRHAVANGVEFGGAKLTKADVRTIKRRLKRGESPYNIASDMPVKAGAVYDVANGKTWSSVTINDAT